MFFSHSFDVGSLQSLKFHQKFIEFKETKKIL